MPRRKNKLTDYNHKEFLDIIIPKITKGVREKKIKLKSVGITNAEDLRLRKYRSLMHMDAGADMIFVAMNLLRKVISSYLVDHLKSSKDVIEYTTPADLGDDLRKVILPSVVGKNSEDYLFCLNLACALQGETISEYYSLLFQNEYMK